MGKKIRSKFRRIRKVINRFINRKRIREIENQYISFAKEDQTINNEEY